MTKLHGKTVLITGGTSGLGLAMARRFIAEGAFVYITGRRADALDRAVSELGAHAAGVQGDVVSMADLDRLMELIRREKGRIDVLVANSGIVLPETLDRATVGNFDRTIDVNLRGLYFTIERALPLLQPGSSVILLSSIAANKGVPGYGTYSASKAAIRSLARTWTAELVARGIRVNSLSPGPFDTPIMDGQADTQEGAEAVRAKWAAAVPMKRLGRPEELAAAALFLASDESSYVSGIDLIVDGGAAAV
ncbi:SDR family NAD(P)-dependent oxidoreductase [Swaminathania salitolerans]|uniref:Oxidoreductase n=1 Tax=Swaminathania salitolerans TaxID=182838 RepID=A0A511BME6_9PROT|nr:SDR family oxidoreductase [Swaminathania salitolerans]GBQ09248.1 short-chain dehydrogenase/reductase SDR [Swaminathania salitolerans LMG 21291]GEL01043.1 oxidoreductase [Swaminathania salitolerans]